LDGESTPRHKVAEVRTIVLVVEDEILTRCSVAEYLREGGYRVIEAANVAEAIGVFGSGIAIEFVFSDINMPGQQDGHALAEWLRQFHPAIPVLMTSGSKAERDKIESGFGHKTIAKPYSLQDVEAVIAAHTGH
jgi:CheY-like chemotaxis protein